MRSRAIYVLVALAVIALGLASRQYASFLPTFIGRYAGDTLWAALAFTLVAIVRPAWSSMRVAAIALAVCYAVETSQLYHAPWIDTVRHTRLGGLALGYGFLWSDLACYTVGVAAGLALESIVREVERSRTR